MRARTVLAAVCVAFLASAWFASPASAAPCTIVGTAGPDRLVGTGGDDVICGLGGDDIIYGLAGDDVLRGGSGEDVLRGGTGDDVLRGGTGDDMLRGGAGNDVLRGGTGDDVLRGGSGDDVLRGGPGDNTIIDPTPQPPLPTPGAWTDPTGDQATGTPDITAVMVGDDGAGRLTFRLGIPDFEKLAEGVTVNIALDVDQNLATGQRDKEELGDGIEYLIVVDGDSPAAELTRWDGAAWERLDSPVTLGWSFGPTVTLYLRDIGNPQAFNFWVGAWMSDSLDGRSGDVAPNTGTWNYRVGTATDAPPPTGAFIIEYVPSDDPQTQGLIDWIDESDHLDWLAQLLNATYALPEDIHVSVEEGRSGPAYFHDSREITMPPRFLDILLYLFEDWWTDPELVRDAAISAFSWVFLHEVGHVFSDVLGLPLTGLEEDAVDQFATVASTSLELPWLAYTGAILFRALAQNRGMPEVDDFWDEHALHEQRDSNTLCLLYGYDPFLFTFIPARFPNAVPRLERCGEEYQQAKSSWENLLTPHRNTTRQDILTSPVNNPPPAFAGPGLVSSG